VSIVERAAELLASAHLGQQKPAAAREATEGQGQGLIERAVGEMSRRLDQPGRKGAAGGGAAGDRAAPPGGTARTCKIDRDRLRAQSMITPDGERTAIAESFRRIKRQILATIASAKAGTPPANLVLVTSALPGEGKTFCAINLAISIALEVDRTVLLVDADVAKPSVPRALGIEAERGLMEVLQDQRIGLADVMWKTDIGRLTLIPAGKAHRHSTELLASDAMRALLGELAQRYRDRIIIFDSPPLLAASEAAALASQMGQVVVVVEAGKTSETALKDALGRIDAGKVAGLLLNKFEGSSLEYGYGGYG
jgi:protein-tyrosine kinase